MTGRVLLPLVGEGGPAKRGRMRVVGAWRGASFFPNVHRGLSVDRVLQPSREPSSDPCFARAAFSHEWEKGGSLETKKSPASPRASGAKAKRENQSYRTAFLSQGGTPLLKR